MGMRLMLYVTKAGEDPGNGVTRTGREEWDTPNAISTSNIETVNCSVLLLVLCKLLYMIFI